MQKQKIMCNDEFLNDKLFAVGLKLFSEVLLQNRKNPLFEDIAPAFRDFMKKLKNSN